MILQPFPAVQVIDRPRPTNPPEDFCPWQFVTFRPKVYSVDAEESAVRLLLALLGDVVRLRTKHYSLEKCPRSLVEDVVAELNEHCTDIHEAIPWCYQQLRMARAA